MELGPPTYSNVILTYYPASFPPTNQRFQLCPKSCPTLSTLIPHTCPLTKLSGPHDPVLSSALHLVLSETISCICLPLTFVRPTHVSLHPSILLDHEAINTLVSFLGGFLHVRGALGHPAHPASHWGIHCLHCFQSPVERRWS